MHILPPMSALRQPLQLFTAEDYLRRERTASFKSEYVNGNVYAMAGGTINHNRIAGNVFRHLGNRLSTRPCEVFNSDLKVRIDKANVFRYPDVSGLCGPILFHDKGQDAYCNPSFIVEVMSPSTELLDRGEKFTLNRLLDSLREYMLVWQDRLRVELFVRNEEGEWNSTIFDEASDEVTLQSLDCTLTLAEIYEKVSFD
jgi:Uma2 family endonuclease